MYKLYKASIRPKSLRWKINEVFVHSFTPSRYRPVGFLKKRRSRWGTTWMMFETRKEALEWIQSKFAWRITKLKTRIKDLETELETVKFVYKHEIENLQIEITAHSPSS